MTVRGSEIVTGLFVVAALGVFVFLAIGAAEGKGNVPCVAYFDDSIGQLGVGQAVSVKGLSVGEIKALFPVISGNTTHIRVEFDITVEMAEQLTDTTRAEVVSVSMLGGHSLQLVLDATGGKLLMDEKEGLYVIENSRTKGPFNAFAMLEQFGKDLEPIIGNVDLMVASLQTELLNKESLGRIRNMIENLNEAVEDLAGSVPDLREQLLGPDGTINGVNRLIQNADELVSDVRGDVLPDLKNQLTASLNSVDVLLAEATGLVAENRPGIKKLLDTTTVTMETAQGTLKSVESDVSKVTANANLTLTDVRGVLNSPDLHGTLYELHRATQEIKLLVMSLRADPSQVLFGGTGVISPAYPADVNRTRSRTEIRAPRYGY